jgi:hypothetical protein
MIPLRWYLAPVAVALVALLGASPAGAQGDPVEQCLDACDKTEETCIAACDNDVDCEDKCFDKGADCRDACEPADSSPGDEGDYEEEPADDEEPSDAPSDD